MRWLIKDLVRAGGRLALEHFRTTGLHTYSIKGRSDFVTQVDRRVEQEIITRIRSHCPDHRIVAEETLGEKTLPIAGPTWLVDPIDGTTNFIRGLWGWAVSIAFCDERGVRLAAVFDPLRGDCFVAESGAGTTLNDERVFCSDCTSVEGALVAQALPFRHTEAMADVGQAVLAVQTRANDMRRSGSAALDLAGVACGRLDAYWELGIQPWDIAAGLLLVEAAGGMVSDLRGQRTSLLHQRSIVAAATPTLHAELLAVTGGLARWLDRAPYLA